MKEQTKKNIKTAAALTGLALGATYLVMRHIAKKQYPKSVYADKPEEQNPVEGKKVVFVEDINDPVNADGKQGHLEAVENSTHIPTFYESYIKRGIDIALSFCGLVVLSPVYAATALAIKKDDPGPVFFKQKRVAQNKGYFELVKFRSMSVNTPKDVPTHMLQNGGITKVGAFIRKTSIDELPQLWNIFRGNMSIIGPRPALWNQDYLTAERDKYGANDVKPGLTGLAQISGRDELEIPEKAKLDGVYAKELSKSSLAGFRMDMKMFFGSIFSVLKHEGIVEGGTGALAKEFAKTKSLVASESNTKVSLDGTSVLMSVYFKENPEFFDLALKSILVDQSIKPDEFVLVCDGQLTDELNEVIAKYENEFKDILKVYRTEENQGLGKALNYGLSKCSYEVIIRADSDDVCAPDRIKQQFEYLNEHSEIAIVGSYIDEFDVDWNNPKNKKELPLVHEELSQMAKFRNPINHMAVAFRKSIIENIGSYRHIPYIEDYELWVRAIIKGYKLANIDKVLVHARVGNGMVKRRGNRQYISSWKELCDYMLQNKMINLFEYVRNMLAIRVFVYMPSNTKEIIYKKILRK